MQTFQNQKPNSEIGNTSGTLPELSNLCVIVLGQPPVMAE
jgi:hypothetical protein